MLQMEFCFHDNFDITAASLANDIVARGDDVLLAEFKERLIYTILTITYVCVRVCVYVCV